MPLTILELIQPSPELHPRRLRKNQQFVLIPACRSTQGPPRPALPAWPGGYARDRFITAVTFGMMRRISGTPGYSLAFDEESRLTNGILACCAGPVDPDLYQAMLAAAGEWDSHRIPPRIAEPPMEHGPTRPPWGADRRTNPLRLMRLVEIRHRRRAVSPRHLRSGCLEHQDVFGHRIRLPD